MTALGCTARNKKSKSSQIKWRVDNSILKRGFRKCLYSNVILINRIDKEYTLFYPFGSLSMKSDCMLIISENCRPLDFMQQTLKSVMIKSTSKISSHSAFQAENVMAGLKIKVEISLNEEMKKSARVFRRNSFSPSFHFYAAADLCHGLVLFRLRAENAAISHHHQLIVSSS